MGQEIASTTFCKKDFEEFAKRLENETKLLKTYFDEDLFEQSDTQFGIELEACLVDKQYNPAPKSVSFLEQVKHDQVVPELSQFNFEINSNPAKLSGPCFQLLHNELTTIWKKCQIDAKKLDLIPLCIGILPTIQKNSLTSKNLYPMHRYQALDKELAKHRNGQPISARINGVTPFSDTFNSILFESTATSLQIHVQFDRKKAVRFYNAAQIISAPLIAMSSNSPFLFGNDLWSETRIPIFEQSTVAPFGDNGVQTAPSRCSFGQGYAQHSLFEPFQENLEQFYVLLPEIKENPEEHLSHLRLHNGTIWRWNRPLVDTQTEKKPSLRIEHRVNPAGPSLTDTIANVALFIGLLNYYANQNEAPEHQIDFNTAKDNFYRCAQHGLDAEVKWLNQNTGPVDALLKEKLLPQAKAGLAMLNIDQQDAEYYLNIVQQRVQSKLTGTAWQRKFIAKYGPDFNNMVYHYLHHQQNNLAVHEWEI